VNPSDKLPLHPAAALFPVMSDEELVALAQDITDNGLKEKITVLDGAILDGQNRYNALVDILGWTNNRVLREAAVKYNNGQSPVSFTVSKNVKRRHLTNRQLARLALLALPLYKAESKQGKRTDLGGTSAAGAAKVLKPIERCAADFHTSPDTMQRVAHIVEEAEAGNPKAVKVLEAIDGGLFFADTESYFEKTEAAVTADPVEPTPDPTPEQDLALMLDAVVELTKTVKKPVRKSLRSKAEQVKLALDVMLDD